MVSFVVFLRGGGGGGGGERERERERERTLILRIITLGPFRPI